MSGSLLRKLHHAILDARTSRMFPDLVLYEPLLSQSEQAYGKDRGAARNAGFEPSRRQEDADGNRLMGPPAELRGRKALLTIEVPQLWITGPFYGGRDIKLQDASSPECPCKLQAQTEDCWIALLEIFRQVV